MIVVFTLLIKTRRKQQARYESDWIHFKESIKNGDIDQINYYGSKVIWNQYKAEPKHRKFVLEKITRRKETHPELTKLWKDAFFLVHGVDPN